MTRLSAHLLPVATGVFLVLLLGSQAPQPAQEAPASPTRDRPAAAGAPRMAAEAGSARSANRTISGTVLAVDETSSSLEVITGVGLALKVLRVHCDEHTDIRFGGMKTRLESVRRGDVVRLACRRDGAEERASRIEVLPPPTVDAPGP